MHVFPGLFYGVKDIEVFWKESFLTAYNNIIAKYSNRIMLQMGAHVHFGEIRAPQMSNDSDSKNIVLVCPSISPIYQNDPGYSVLDIEQNTEH
jgi:hypothetical protein